MLAGHYRFIVFLFGLFLGSFIFAKKVKVEDLIDIQVICDTSEVSRGSEIWIGLEISLAPGWHIYWKNAGESGYPTSVNWKLPRGWSADPLQFPVPDLYEYGGISGYILDKNFTLLARLSAPSFMLRSPEIGGVFDALICNESSCLPYKYPFFVSLNLADKQKLNEEKISVLNRAKNLLPVKMPENVSARASFGEGNGQLFLKSEQFSNLSLEEVSFFPETPHILADMSNLSTRTDSNSLQIDWHFTRELKEFPSSLDGLINHPDFGSAWRVSVPLTVDGSIPQQQISTLETVPSPNDFLLLNILLGMVVISMAAWAYGRSCQPGVFVRSWQIFACTSLLAGLWLVYPSKSKVISTQSLNWQSWSQKLEDELLAEGRAVYIDYTAKWCLSCQVNKRVYADISVRNALMEKKVSLLRADWTKKSQDILKSLQSHGREGVPFNVYYPAQKGKNVIQPIYFPEILSSGSLAQTIREEESRFDNSLASNNFLALLGIAWLGGLILNLMPCVFPVIGLKILGFVKQAGSDRGLISLHGWIFTIGVVLSFWVLVGLLLALRDGLEYELGWGFQLQEPAFVGFLSIILLLFGLSLSGVFEMGMSISGVGSGLAQKSGLAGSFFSGVLATVVATPCMAPFLGVAVGAALTMPALSSFSLFTCIALGLSTPYLLLSFFPAWLQKLPKPGAWMESFRQLMAFPVYATVAWLIWTLDGLL